MNATEQSATERSSNTTPTPADQEGPGASPFGRAAGAPWPPNPTREQERAWQQAHAPRASGIGNAPANGSGTTPHGEPAYTPQSVQTLMTWALVLGIVSVFINPLAGVSIAAIICAAVALGRHSTLVRAGVPMVGNGAAIAGLVLGIIGFLGTAGLKFFLF